VISYFFQGKYNIFLTAEGKSYITTNIATIISIGVSLCKAIALINGGNVVVIQSIYFAFNLVQVMIITGYMKKHYPWIDLSVAPNFQAISQKNAVLVHQISGLIFNNTDVILLTALTSLKTVSVYSMYNMIFGMVKSVAVTFSDSFVYALGQSYHDKKKFLCIYDVYEIYSMAITFALFCIAGVLILPFLRLYTSGVNDIDYIDCYVAILFIVMNLMSNGRKASQTVINIAQHFEKTKWRSILESAINLTASVVLTKQFGIYGVLMGTIVALFYQTNDVIIYSARLLERSPLITYKRWGINWLLLILVVWVTSFFDFDLGNYVNLVIYGIALCITVIPVFVGVNSILEPQSAKYAFAYFKNMIKSRAAA
jgi:O-antigen/teichoic acid export membrane protein